jgi:xanthine dehydrogenase large subunit
MTVAKPLPHDSAELHVRGAAQYADDIPTPANTLHLAFGISEIARGEITKMDLSPVRNAEGVVAVLTALDLPAENDVSPSAHDEPLLSDGSVHHVGQPIYLVVATSHLLARKAARLAEIKYTASTPILTIDQAMAANSRFEEPVIYAKGNAQFAVETAPNRITSQFEMGGQEHFYLEGQASLAVPHDDGDITVHCSTQHPTEIQHKVADALGKPMHAVRVQVRRMGGGFGGKESQGNALAVACAVVATQTGRPCKMRYDRDDDMVITGKRHDFRIAYDVGFDAEGRIIGICFEQFARCGWAQDLSIPVADRAMLHADNAYFLPHARITSHRLKTNTQSATAFRGFGGPQGVLGIEQVMEHIAQHLKLDASDVRMVNHYADITNKEQAQTTPYHMPVTDSIITPLTATLLESSDYAARRVAVDEWNASHPILKRGLAITPVKFGISFTLTHLNQAGALVHVYQDGSIRINHGGTEMGQGLFQKVAQVAASSFGQPIENVKITATDTAKVPNTSATAASSGSDLNGMAVKDACDQIIARLRKFLAEEHGERPRRVRFTRGVVVVGDQHLAFKDVISRAYQNRISLSSTGFYATPEIEWDRVAGRGTPFFYFAYGAAVTEVVIDTLTGENRILRADLLHDAGKSLNPALDIGQVQGGYVQGAGWLTTEELIWDDAGHLKTHAPSTYKIPACSDRPRVFNTQLYKPGVNRSNTIYRSKAVGEPPLMLGISALMALNNAVAACGPSENIVMMDTPATPERILFAVKQKRGEKS